ncbi:endonuclease domain-containing protein [Streptomyces sp. NPDC091259]|uniref:endonuclease domain-containing protein n=1 Tax=Streptomyces sp. NPDC091259 TaxID=3365976 RepID=UPI00380839D0
MPYWFVWWRLFELQKGRCACCLASPSVVDHDHRSGAIRGLLCVSCNRLESAYYRRERLCVHEPPHCFDLYWRNPPALSLGWEKVRGMFLRPGREPLVLPPRMPWWIPPLPVGPSQDGYAATPAKSVQSAAE